MIGTTKGFLSSEDGSYQDLALAASSGWTILKKEELMLKKIQAYNDRYLAECESKGSAIIQIPRWVEAYLST